MAAAVPFAMKAAPVAAGALGAIFGKKTSGPSAPQQAAMTGTQQSAAQLASAGGALQQEGQAARGTGAGYVQQGVAGMQRGAQDLGGATSYYRNILGRGRGGAEAALAPERSQALDYYRGAGSKISRTVRGPQRDTQLAELDRQKVGQLAGMTGLARRGAAEGLVDVGSRTADIGSRVASTGLDYYQGGNQLSQVGMGGQANALYGQNALFNQGSQLQEQAQQGGKSWGNILYDLAASMPWGKGKSQSPRMPAFSMYQGF